MISSFDMVGLVTIKGQNPMRRFLLTTAAASLVMLAACTDALTGARAAADDGGQARVHLLSGAEVVASSLRHDTARRSDEAPACAKGARPAADTHGQTQEARREPACDTGTED
jgi:hypothetical protein